MVKSVVLLLSKLFEENDDRIRLVRLKMRQMARLGLHNGDGRA